MSYSTLRGFALGLLVGWVLGSFMVLMILTLQPEDSGNRRGPHDVILVDSGEEPW